VLNSRLKPILIRFSHAVHGFSEPEHKQQFDPAPERQEEISAQKEQRGSRGNEVSSWSRRNYIKYKIRVAKGTNVLGLSDPCG
jgi:hypothetical protein